jgi:hypothetical protein
MLSLLQYQAAQVAAEDIMKVLFHLEDQAAGLQVAEQVAAILTVQLIPAQAVEEVVEHARQPHMVINI